MSSEAMRRNFQLLDLGINENLMKVTSDKVLRPDCFEKSKLINRSRSLHPDKQPVKQHFRSSKNTLTNTMEKQAERDADKSAHL